MNHDVNDYDKYVESDPIVIGDNCWLATGCTILSGVQLGNHVVVAAGAVVTKSFRDNDIVLAGVPARVAKKLPPYGSGTGIDVNVSDVHNAGTQHEKREGERIK